MDPSSAASEVVGEGEKRSITYQMAKNKGLMPKRSKESRNPRVKHKEKFKKALKKRRSIVSMPLMLEDVGVDVFGMIFLFSSVARIVEHTVHLVPVGPCFSNSQAKHLIPDSAYVGMKLIIARTGHF